MLIILFLLLFVRHTIQSSNTSDRANVVQTGATIVFYFLTKVSMMLARAGMNLSVLVLRKWSKADKTEDAVCRIVGAGCIVLTPTDSEIWILYAVTLIHGSSKQHRS